MPTIDIPTKVCPHCGGIRWIEFNRKYKVVSGEVRITKGYKCAKKNVETNNIYRQVHIEQHRITAATYVRNKRKTNVAYADYCRKLAKEYYQLNKAERTAYRKKWASLNLDKDKAYYRKNAKKQASSLTDYYLSRRIISRSYDLKRPDIPDDLIILKRKQLSLKRKLKQNGKD